MLARYKIYRGRPPEGVTTPAGVRQDTRKHTRHCLRPPAELVASFLARPTNEAWEEFAATYRQVLLERWETDPLPFDRLAELAMRDNVYLGCSCPTKKNPQVEHCHTFVALQFMKERYPRIEIQLPASSSSGSAGTHGGRG